MIELVSNWKSLWKAWSMWAASLGLMLPELLQIVSDNIDGFEWFDSGWKTIIRITCLAAVLALRPLKQVTVTPEK